MHSFAAGNVSAGLSSSEQIEIRGAITFLGGRYDNDNSYDKSEDCGVRPGSARRCEEGRGGQRGEEGQRGRERQFEGEEDGLFLHRPSQAEAGRGRQRQRQET
ncbi:hypothetical protein N431DRAFT_206720 [Stipitochalara longipes BDJ]|nr:hypothetical protein N431DRAFT_206720 [Stipitochalara longipes BDJ]